MDCASFRMASILVESALREREVENMLATEKLSDASSFEAIFTLKEIIKIVSSFATTYTGQIKITISVDPILTYLKLDKKTFLMGITVMLSEAIKNIESSIDRAVYSRKIGVFSMQKQ